MTTTKKAPSKRSQDSRRRYKGVDIRKDKRLAIYLRDGFCCVYCLRDLHGAKPFDITLDHVVANADGGTNHESNLVTACRACNCSRQDKPVERFAGPETLAHIARNTARALKEYRIMAKALIAGKTDHKAE